MRVAVEGGVDEERDLGLLSVEFDDGGVVDVAGEGFGRADVDAQQWGELAVALAWT